MHVNTWLSVVQHILNSGTSIVSVVFQLFKCEKATCLDGVHSMCTCVRHAGHVCVQLSKEASNSCLSHRGAQMLHIQDREREPSLKTEASFFLSFV